MSYLTVLIVNMVDCINCKYGCNCQKHRDFINSYYDNIVVTLLEASCSSVHRAAFNSLKLFWNDVLDNLNLINLINLIFCITYGLMSGFGELHNINFSSKAKYQLAIRDAYDSFEDRLSDDMSKHFVNRTYRYLGFENHGNPNLERM